MWWHFPVWAWIYVPVRIALADPDSANRKMVEYSEVPTMGEAHWFIFLLIMPEGTSEDDSDQDGGMPEDVEDCARPQDLFRARTESLDEN